MPVACVCLIKIQLLAHSNNIHAPICCQGGTKPLDPAAETRPLPLQRHCRDAIVKCLAYDVHSER